MKDIIFVWSIFLLLLLPSCQQDRLPNKGEENPIEEVIPDPCPLGNYKGVTISYQDSRNEIDELGATVVHFWYHWDFTEPEIFDPNLTVDEVTEQMIQDYSTGNKVGIDWSFTDDFMTEFEGLDFIVGVGSGWLTDMPIYNGTKITPDDIGRENYLGLLYLYTRSCVRRYGDKVLGWQIENEPNVALETAFVGIRNGASWGDIDFVTEVLQTLERAVREEDPDTWITINFHTDLHYEEDITRWLSLIDVVGIDAYPNYLNGDSVLSDVVFQRIARAKELSNGKPVVVMETGYASAPTSSGFSEEKQNTFIENIYSGIDDSGACGVFLYKLSSPEEDGNASIPFPQENYWGLLNKDGSHKLGWQTLKNFMD